MVVQVDNIGCHFAWENGYSKTDSSASILVRILVLVSEFLNCNIIINHHPRETSWEIRLADRLSREKSTESQDKRLLASFRERTLPSSFRNWMRNPVEDWNLPVIVVSELSNSFSFA